MNPARRTEQSKERRSERFLTGATWICHPRGRDQRTPWDVDERKPKTKHLPKAKKPFHQDRPLRCGSDPAAAVHRLPASGNPAPQMGAGRPTASRLHNRTLRTHCKIA